MKIWMDILKVALLSITSLAALFLVSRFGGKRQIAQMSMFDYVNSITIGSIAAEMATNLEEWYKPFTGIIVYGLLAWLVHIISCKSLKARVLISGKSICLMSKGVIHKGEMGRASIDLNEFLAQCRIAGYFDMNEIDSAVLETNGQISFLPKSRHRPVTTADLNLSPAPAANWIDLVMDGQLQQQGLQKAEKDQTWLLRQLQRQDIQRIGSTFYAACDDQGNFFACPKEK